MSGNKNLKEISDLLEKLKKESQQVDEMIDKLNGMRDEVKRVVESFRESSGRDVDTTIIDGLSPSQRDLLEKVSSDLGQKISTGNEKLDALLYGGVEKSTNIVLRGPPFSGKSIISHNFVSQSLRDSIPCVILTADKDVGQIEKSLSSPISQVEKAEDSGKLRFIDAYSRSIQTSTGPSKALQVDPYNLSSLIKAVDSITAEVSKQYGSYRFLLTSLTSFMTQQEEKIFLRFLQQISQKRKSEGATSLYVLEDGLFDERMYEAVSYLMDGAIHLRKTFTTNYLRVEGMGKARSREWIEMYPKGNTFDLGSFTLERVR